MTLLLLTGTARTAQAQLSALVSPGRLSQAHASLEGFTSCLKCHTASRGVTAEKCLACHKPVAERIALKRGVHRNVTTDCISCHVEHAGVSAELRPFDQKGFNHAAQAGYPLDGQHATLAGACASCHKSRSFLTLSTGCVSCHTDTHKGSLGPRCETCHTTSVKFAETRLKFDHSRTAFRLAGAHRSVGCASCHVNNVYKPVKFGECSSCHADPHRSTLGATCSNCHTAAAWKTQRIDHSRTAFPLKGLHAEVACVDCHRQPATKVVAKFDTCATCHTDPHKGAFKQDCQACHSENGFKTGATFDHSVTRFPLTDGHAALTCAQCHKPAAPAPPAAARGVRPIALQAAPPVRGPAQSSGAVDFSGLQTTCASCHTDVHQGDLGAACENCHNARTFKVPAYNHARPRDFFQGAHTPVRCEQCHTATFSAVSTSTKVPPPRVGLPATPTACISCHADVHLGQLDRSCETCHAVATPHFTVEGFAHDGTRYPLTGKHTVLMCAACHKADTAAFPRGTGTAVRYRPLATTCVTCHQDPHRGELASECQTCHTTQSFALDKYTHRNARALRSFFAGRHNTATCVDCHKTPVAGRAPAAGVVLRGARPISPAQPVTYKTSTACVTCHQDIHRGALGPNCDTCHRP